MTASAEALKALAGTNQIGSTRSCQHHAHPPTPQTNHTEPLLGFSRTNVGHE